MTGTPETASFAMNTAESVRWLVFNVVIALFPIWAAQIVRFATHTEGSFAESIREGDLLIFASTISASGLGTGLFERDLRVTYIAFACTGLILLLMVSGGLVFIIMQGRLETKEMMHRGRTMGLSIFCAAGASILAYVVQGSRSIG